jgi:hypothetical protein
VRPELTCAVLRSRVVLLAETRLGAELKAAQARGEIGAQGRRSDLVRSADEVRPAISDLSIPKQRAAEMKRLAALGEEAITQAVAAATEERRGATRPLRRPAPG